MKGLTIILPSAGLGERLGVNKPKELLEIYKGLPLIQFALQHMLVSLGKECLPLKVAVVIRKGKELVVDYVRGVLPQEVEVCAVYADPRWEEWPGSIYSAREQYSELNLVLLPDSFISLSETDWQRTRDKQTLLDLAVSGLERSQVVFGTLACDDKETLSQLGAVRRDAGGEITAFQDKPSDPTGFNAFWGCFAFRSEVSETLYRFLSESVRHANPDYSAQSFFPAQSFSLADYADLGTWDAIEAFRASYPVETLGLTCN